MFSILSWLQSQGYIAKIEEGFLMVDRNCVHTKIADVPPHELYEYFEMVIQDAFPKISIRMCHKNDSWILFQKA